jgi:hypothetical protein
VTSFVTRNGVTPAVPGGWWVVGGVNVVVEGAASGRCPLPTPAAGGQRAAGTGESGEPAISSCSRGVGRAVHPDFACRAYRRYQVNIRAIVTR